MKQSALYEQIEAYLNHTLPPDQLKAFEQRLTEDMYLRQEVELHRQLQNDYNTGRLKLRDNIYEIMQEPLAPALGNGKRWWPWIVLSILVLIGAFGVWQWQTSAPVSPKTPAAETPAVEQNQTPVVPPTINPDTTKTTRPMAMSDPARFVPNPGMEAFVNSGVRSETIAIKMSIPVNGIRLMPNEKGAVTIQFKGIITPPNDLQPARFILAFFDNRNMNKPLRELPVPTKGATVDSLTFDMQQRLNFPPGLYYFTIEAVDKGEVLYAGKFFVGKELTRGTLQR